MEKIKSKLSKAIGICLVASALFSCEKEQLKLSSLNKEKSESSIATNDFQVYTETPLHTFILNSWGLVLNKGTGWTYDWMGGYQFYSKRDGTISRVAMRVPAAGTYYLRLWDSATRKTIGKATFNSSSPDQVVFASLPSLLTITANRKYVITVTLQSYMSYYSLSKSPAFSGNLMPFTSSSGNIVIEHGCWKSIVPGLPPESYSDYNMYPGNSNVSHTHIYGYPDIQFSWVSLPWY